MLFLLFIVLSSCQDVAYADEGFVRRDWKPFMVACQGFASSTESFGRAVFVLVWSLARLYGRSFAAIQHFETSSELLGGWSTWWGELCDCLRASFRGWNYGIFIWASWLLQVSCYQQWTMNCVIVWFKIGILSSLCLSMLVFFCLCIV